MKKTALVFGALTFLAAAFLQVGASHAAPANMVTAGRTAQPIGHHQFCVAHGEECGRTTDGPTAPAVLTREKWAAMLEVNVGVNRSVYPLTDMQIHGREEIWSYPVEVGDCEDYVLLKRQKLMERGFSASDLLITVVLQPGGAGHAVLTVRTDHGDFVLDNMRDRVLLWSETEYVFLKRQSSEHAGVWQTISDNRDPMAVGSVR
jgi:predicted transglutaminase-like cysteine proteinase